MAQKTIKMIDFTEQVPEDQDYFPGIHPDGTHFKAKISSVVSSVQALVDVHVDEIYEDILEKATAVSTDAAEVLLKADEIEELISTATNGVKIVGTYNASTNVATMRNASGADTTFTPVATPTLPAGQALRVTNEGTQGITGISTLFKVGGSLASRGPKWDYEAPADTGYGLAQTNSSLISLLNPVDVGVTIVPLVTPSPIYDYYLYTGAGAGSYRHTKAWYFPRTEEHYTQVGVLIYKNLSTGALTGTAKLEVLHKRGSTVTVLLRKVVANADLIHCNTTGYSGNAAQYEVKVNLDTQMTVLPGDTLFIALEVIARFTHFIGSANADQTNGEWNNPSNHLCYRAGDTDIAETVDFTDIPTLPTGVATYSPVHFYGSSSTVELQRVKSLETGQTTTAAKLAVLEPKVAALELRPNRKLVLTSSSTTTVTINGAEARIVLSNNYDYKGDPDTLLIICHGNGQNNASGPSSSARAFLAANKISYAIINVQDQSNPPFSTQAMGWGNQITLRRNKELYDYLQDKYNFKKEVILAGQSMGGLAMGNIVYKRLFPVLFCIGIGPVPSLRLMWDKDNYADQKRKVSIRAAYGMAAVVGAVNAGSVGANDAAIADFIQGYDWWATNLIPLPRFNNVGVPVLQTVEGVTTQIVDNKKPFGPNLYIRVGNGDTTFSNDFGGTASYTALVDAIKAAGGYVTYSEKAGADHADITLWDDIISQGVFTRELGIV